MKERKEKDWVNSRKLNFFRNKSGFERVQSMDLKVKKDLEKPKTLYKKRKMYSHLVREKFKPAKSEVNIEKTFLMQ
jgi:hypothetical protein